MTRYTRSIQEVLTFKTAQFFKTETLSHMDRCMQQFTWLARGRQQKLLPSRYSHRLQKHRRQSHSKQNENSRPSINFHSKYKNVMFKTFFFYPTVCDLDNGSRPHKNITSTVSTKKHMLKLLQQSASWLDRQINCQLYI